MEPHVSVRKTLRQGEKSGLDPTIHDLFTSLVLNFYTVRYLCFVLTILLVLLHFYILHCGLPGLISITQVVENLFVVVEVGVVGVPV